MMLHPSDRQNMVSASEALSGRSFPIVEPRPHFVLGTPIAPPFPEGLEQVIVALGCFWGAERDFWTQTGVYTTAVGYSGGYTPNPTYEEVCSGRTGHAESVLVVFDPSATSLEKLLAVFFESHDPTQHMRQGNDIGTQYRSAIYTASPAQVTAATAARTRYGELLSAAGFGAIETEIAPAGDFYYAEDYHQQYLAKNPAGYCGIGGTGIACPTGLLGPNGS